MNVRPGVPWVDPPFRYFSGHGYSELLASGLKYKINGKQVDVSIPMSILLEEREEIISRLKQIGFDGLVKLEKVYNKETNCIEITIEVE